MDNWLIWTVVIGGGLAVVIGTAALWFLAVGMLTRKAGFGPGQAPDEAGKLHGQTPFRSASFKGIWFRGCVRGLRYETGIHFRLRRFLGGRRCWVAFAEIATAQVRHSDRSGHVAKWTLHDGSEIILLHELADCTPPELVTEF